jgi:hypothetical protein
MKESNFNPFAIGTAEELATLLLFGCDDELSQPERDQLAGEVHAIVPALVELRDAGLLQLNARLIVEYATLEGLTRLSADARLSQGLRARCSAVREQLLVDAVHTKVLERLVLRKLQ